MDFLWIILQGVFIALLAMLVIFIITALFVHLWNITVPGIFQLREIEFWEGFRLLLLSCILFGGCGLSKRQDSVQHDHSHGHCPSAQSDYLSEGGLDHTPSGDQYCIGFKVTPSSLH